MNINSKNVKHTTSIITCLMTFLFGWGLTIAGFIVPPLGEVSNSVLWILGQSLLYCGAILGISTHYENKLNEFEAALLKKIKNTEKN